LMNRNIANKHAENVAKKFAFLSTQGVRFVVDFFQD